MPRSLQRVLVALLAVIAASTALGNQVLDIPLERKIRLSSIVALVETREVYTPALNEPLEHPGKFARLAVLETYHGRHESDLMLAMDGGGIAEFAPRCCKVGQRYLLFAFARRGRLANPVRGPFGVYAVEGGRVIGWTGSGAPADVPLEDVVAAIAKASADTDPPSEVSAATSR